MPSIEPNIAANTTTSKQTIITDPESSSREGQVIFLTSDFVSLTKTRNLLIKFAFIKSSSQFVFKLFLAGQEGLEPPTNGFGVRRSTIGATNPRLFLFYFFMNCMASQFRTVLFQRQFAELSFLRNHDAVVTHPAFRTFKMYDRSVFCHFRYLCMNLSNNLEPASRIELLTSPLPRGCSTTELRGPA